MLNVRGSLKRVSFVIIGALGLALAGCGRESGKPDMAHAWSREPPGGLEPAGIPQLVSITFDDNFGLADPASAGGMNYILDFYKDRRNPPGTGNAENFDGAPIKTTFYYTSIYLIDSAVTVLRGKPGEDEMGRNRAAWTAAVQAGHEAA